MGALWAAAFSLAIVGNIARQASDPEALLKEADRLGWLRAWTQAEPIFLEAQKVFTARGDERNALYAEVSALRGRLPRMSVPEASAQLAEYLERPLVRADDRLRLRVLTIKGDTDVDLDPGLAGESWREAGALAEKLGDAALANRAKGELGLIAFLLGDVGASVVGLGQAVKVAQSNGDVSSLVRWLTLFGHGYVQLGRPQEALDFYDRALKAAAAVPELQFPVMTYVGKSNALIKLGRVDEADAIVSQAVGKAAEAGSRGYQAQLLMQRGMIANQRKQRRLMTELRLLGELDEERQTGESQRQKAGVSQEPSRVCRHGRVHSTQRRGTAGRCQKS